METSHGHRLRRTLNDRSQLFEFEIAGEKLAGDTDRLNSMDLDVYRPGDSAHAFSSVTSVDWTRIPFRYRRRKVFASQYGDGEALEGVEAMNAENGFVSAEQASKAVQLGTPGSTERRGDANSDLQERRVTFSERRRRKGFGTFETSPQDSIQSQSTFQEALSTENQGGKVSMDIDANVEATQAQESEATLDTAVQPLDGHLASSVPMKVVQRYPEVPMRTVRQAIRQERRDNGARKVDDRKLHAAPSVSAAIHSPTDLSHEGNAMLDKTQERQVLEKLVALEGRIKAQLEKRAFSDDVLAVIREQVHQLDSLLRLCKEKGIDRVTHLKQSVNEAMRALRIQMVSYMTQTTQYTFESLEDVRSQLISQILADEEQVQWELEKMDAEMGTIAHPINLLQQMAQMASPTSVMQGSPINMAIGGMSPLTVPAQLPTSPLPFHPNHGSPPRFIINPGHPVSAIPFPILANPMTESQLPSINHVSPTVPETSQNFASGGENTEKTQNDVIQAENDANNTNTSLQNAMQISHESPSDSTSSQSSKIHVSTSSQSHLPSSSSLTQSNSNGAQSPFDDRDTASSALTTSNVEPNGRPSENPTNPLSGSELEAIAGSGLDSLLKAPSAV